MPEYIYVAGPLSHGDWFVNVRNAVLAAERLRAAGLVPFVPHLSATWQPIVPVDYEGRMAYGLAWVERCDALLRIPGHSPGANREADHAAKLGIPVFYSVADVIDWATTDPKYRQPPPTGHEQADKHVGRG